MATEMYTGMRRHLQHSTELSPEFLLVIYQLDAQTFVLQ